MAVRKKTAKKKTTRKASGSSARTRASDTLATLEEQLPARLTEYSKRVEKALDRLEKAIADERKKTGKEATRLLRLASRRVGELETKGQAAWRKLSTPYRRDAAKLLHRLEKAIAPPPGARASKTKRKK